MPGGKYCCICKNSYSKDPHIRLHRFPKDEAKRLVWLTVFGLQQDGIKEYMRVCSRHFPGGDVSKPPAPELGKRLCSPLKKDPRAKRARIRDDRRSSSALSPSASRSVTPSTEQPCCSYSLSPPSSITPIGEPYQQDFMIHELSYPDEQSHTDESIATLKARIEYLEAEKASLKLKIEKEKKPDAFRVEQIQHDDGLIRFYTGFVTFQVLIAFFDFLGPVVSSLNYWGTKEGDRSRCRPRKFSPLNGLFLTLVKLRLNLKIKDLAFRFGLSVGQTSNYLTTWICFLYKHLNEIDWMPSVDQVKGTLPASFRGKYDTTYAIIDGSEIFMETPSDLFMQSSTWSEYKHHNTMKFLVACTPNGSICFISELYVGSISDVELTKESGFLKKLENKRGISIMADRGFTIKDILKELNVELNIPPFLEGRQQLPAVEVDQGRSIASLRIHVERAIGRIKTYSICSQTIPITMARLANQIICVCAFLSNFQPALVSQELDPEQPTESDVDKYFAEVDSDD